jgi:hypothetical protein
MLIGHKASLSLEPERDTRGSDNRSLVARYSSFSMTVRHSLFAPRDSTGDRFRSLELIEVRERLLSFGAGSFGF